MLIISRRVGESVLIGKDISITVLRVKGDQVRLGVDAPKEVPVQRDELSEEARTRLAAAAAQTSDMARGSKGPAS